MRTDALLSRIVEAASAKQPPSGMSTRIVAIDGLGGAGKSSLALLLARELGGVPVVHTDEFADRDNPLNWWPRLVDEVLEPLSRNQVARYRRTNWGDEDHEEWAEVAPSEFIVLEGVSSSRNAFKPFLAYSIWIETSRKLRLKRGLDRDGQKARALWERWMAAEDEYVEREHPRAQADLVLSGDQNLWS